MASDNLDSADLKAVLAGGLIAEDVMDKIWDISNIPLVVQPMFGDGPVSNSYSEWTTDELPAPNPDNAKVDGADTINDQDVQTGERMGNHCQISTKTVKVSSRADASGTIGFARALAYQVMRRQIDLRRDVDHILMTEQASVADDGNTTPGRAGGFFACLKTNTYHGVGGSAGGFNTSTKVVDAPTPGTKRALTETMVRDACQAVYEKGGNPSIFMSTPTVIRRFSEYCFTSSARIATLQKEVPGLEPGKAVGAVNVFLTDFGVTLELTPNRLHPEGGAGAATANVGIIDPAYAQVGKLEGYRVEPLAKTGLAEKRQMAVDWTLKFTNEQAHAGIFDIDETAAVTES